MNGDFEFQKDNVLYGKLYPALRSIKDAVIKQNKGDVTYYCYEPGNCTRYDVIFSRYSAGHGVETVMTIANMRKAMIIPGYMFSVGQLGYMQEKLGLGDGDCYALMQLINHYLDSTGE